VDQVTDPFGDPNAVILSLSLPSGSAYLVTATFTVDISLTSTASPSFQCYLWYGSPTSPTKIDQWANVFQARNDGTQNSKKFAFNGPTPDVFSSTTTVTLSCAAPAGVFPVTGLGVLESEMTAVTIPAATEQ
jgi:hypothetical protein